MTAHALPRRRVLVVDDEPDLADVTGALLSHHGFEVSVAHSGQEALRLLAGGTQVDSVFTDVMMPEMTGLELAAAVRRTDPEIRIVITSGFTPPALLRENGHAYLYAPKPYMIETIIELLCR